MFKTLRPVFFLFIGIILALASSALAPNTIAGSQALPSTTATLAQTLATPTPVPEKEMVPGNTNIILILGAILVVIIITAILWHRRDWEK